MFPGADIFTHVYVPERISEEIRSHRVHTTFVQKLPGARRHHQWFLPVMPIALEQVDLRDYDLVISSESGPAKGVIVRPDAIHLCYCHSPMRYIWDLYQEHLRYLRGPGRMAMRLIAHYMRMWDAESARRVSAFVANSRFVAQRVRAYYQREAQVVHPPVDIGAFSPSEPKDDEYLVVSQLVPYKRIDLAIAAFNRSGRKLTVIGEGALLDDLRALARPNVRLVGWQPFEVIREQYARCRALIFPGLEDFGIVPVEAMASGKPVIAYRGGGALETVVEGRTGVFFDEQSPDSLNRAIGDFERKSPQFSAAAIAEHARRFDRSAFVRGINAIVERITKAPRTERYLEDSDGERRWSVA